VARSRSPIPLRGLLGLLALLALVLPAPLVIVGCGPSFQAVYEGNARFEHCYALEENPQAPMPDKASCWRDWSERYTYGQTRDRIHYATARYVALSQAPNLPTDEALMMAAPGEAPRVSTITAPTPTNAFAPPPKVLEPSDASVTNTPNHMSEAAGISVLAADAGAPSPRPAALPAATCADACASTYRGCGDGCDDVAPGSAASREASKKSRSCQACLKTYRTCMRACFK
jgi:hypothetical protein